MKKKPAQNINNKAKRSWKIPMITVGIFAVILLFGFYQKSQKPKEDSENKSQVTEPVTLPSQHLALPSPDLKSTTSVELSIKQRRSRRSYLDQSVTLKEVSQMLWSAQGVTSDWGGRAAPSAKSTYPLTVYLIANKVDGLEPGFYEYLPGDRQPVHQLKTIAKGSFGDQVFTAINQNSFKNVPAIFIITGDMAKMARAFGGVAQDKDVYLEVGHVAENMYLQSESLKLGMVTNSSFKDPLIRNIITIPEEETIIYMIPFGHPKD